MSAGTLSPLASRTTSPGTRSAVARVSLRPSRKTETFSGTMRVSASIALPALNSCTKPMIVLSTTTARITSPFLTPPVGSTAIATSADTINTQIKGLLICRQIRSRAVSPFPRGMTLGPWIFRRCAASALVRPSGRVRVCSITSSARRACHGCRSGVSTSALGSPIMADALLLRVFCAVAFMLSSCMRFSWLPGTRLMAIIRRLQRTTMPSPCRRRLECRSVPAGTPGLLPQP